MKGLGIYKNTSTLEETTVLPIGINRELQGREREVKRVFGIEVNGVRYESNICASAHELNSKTFNGALWMGSYLQGLLFSIISKHKEAIRTFIEE